MAFIAALAKFWVVEIKRKMGKKMAPTTATLLHKSVICFSITLFFTSRAIIETLALMLYFSLCVRGLGELGYQWWNGSGPRMNGKS